MNIIKEKMNKTMYRTMSIITAFILALGSFTSTKASSTSAPQMAANSYYVSVSGSDQNTCTFAAPCKTFTKAMSFAQFGDTIQLLPGTYSQRLLVSKDGLTILGNDAVIDGGNTGNDPCVKISGDNVVVDHITVKNCHSHGIIVFGQNDTVQNSTVTNSVLENYPPKSSNRWGSAFKAERGSGNVTFLQNTAIGNFGEGFGITMTVGATLSGNTSIDNYSVNFYTDNSSNVVMDGNLAACSGAALYNRDGKRPTGISLGEESYSNWTTHPYNTLISNNVISGCGSGITYWGTGVSGGGLDTVTIRNNTIYSGTDTAFSLAYESENKNVVIANNIFYSSPSPWVPNKKGITFQDNFWMGSIPSNNARGINDKSGDPSFATTPVWNNADSFRLPVDSPACGYGRWSCVDSGTTEITEFADIPVSYWAYPSIIKLYQNGITGGCGSAPLIFCPEKPVTRAEMAIFIERSLKGANYTPPNTTSQFGDTANHWAQDWIDAAATDGITSGCGNGNYCPDNIVTRAQMSIFLLHAMHGASYAPSAASGSMFLDVPTSYWAASWIEQFALEGITSGCAGGNYCPDDSVTRAQLAVFLVRAFNIQ